MSETVTHAEIEDVLTSIRRLVTSKSNGAGRLSSAGGRHADGRNYDGRQTDGLGNGRLVLTPALRVAEPPAPQQDAVTTNGATTDITPTLDLAADETGLSPAETLNGAISSDAESLDEGRLDEGRLNSVQGAAAEIAGEDTIGETTAVQQDASTVPADSVPEPLVLAQSLTDETPGAPLFFEDVNGTELPSDAEAEAVDQATTEVAAADNTQTNSTQAINPQPDTAEAEDAPWRDPSATLYAAVKGAVPPYSAGDPAEAERMGASHRAAAVVRRIAEIETAHNAGQAVDGGEHWAEADNEDDVEAVPAVPPMSDTSQTPDLAAQRAADQPAYMQADVSAETVTEALEAAPAEPEMLRAETAAPAAPEEFVAEEVAPLPPQGADELMAAAATEMAQEAVERRTLETVSEQDAYLDENSLRELVADIVRQELQGALGERITRNVRKLVRREIQRALATQELF